MRKGLLGAAVAILLVSGGGSPGAASARTVTAVTAPAPTIAAEQQAATLCAQGDRLRADGLDDDARAAYEKALAQAWDAPCVPDGLDHVTHGALVRAGGAVVAFLPTLLVGIAAAGIAIALLLMVGYLPWGAGRWLQTHRPLRLLLHPRLSLQPLNTDALGDGTKVGEAMTARIRERLQAFRAEALDTTGTGYVLDRTASNQRLIDVVGDDSGLQAAVGKLGDADEHTRIVAAILGLLYATLPITRLTLAGVVEPAADGVPGATLALQNGARLVASTTVRAAPVAAGSTAAGGDYLKLCSAAAIWTQYEIARELGDRVGPDEADSYRLVREGLDAREAGDAAGAVERFEEAIAALPRNWTAHVNLFATLHAEDPCRALAPRIKGAMEEMREPEPGAVAARPRRRRAPGRLDPHQLNPNYYRLGHQLLAEYANRAAALAFGGGATAEPARRRLLVEGAQEAAERMEEVDAVLLDLVGRSDAGWWLVRAPLSNQELRLAMFLAGTVRPCMHLLAAGIAALHRVGDAWGFLQAEGPQSVPRQPRRLRADVLVTVTWSPRAFYDLACFGALAPDRRIPERDLRRVANLPSPRPGTRPSAAPPVHPGLWGLQQALRLSHGTERALLVARARRDPTLAPLLRDPVLGPDANAALARYAIEPAAAV